MKSAAAIRLIIAVEKNTSFMELTVLIRIDLLLLCL